MLHPDHFIFDGKPHRFDHLKPHWMNFEWIGKDKKKLPVAVFVRYSSHCYSVGAVEAEIDPALVINDGHKKREFCIDRYGLSLQLPNVIGDLAASPIIKVHQTNERNWTFSKTLSISKTEDYHVFFRVNKTVQAPGQSAAQPGSVDLFVESAYLAKKRNLIRQTLMFGRVVEKLINDEPI